MPYGSGTTAMAAATQHESRDRSRLSTSLPLLGVPMAAQLPRGYAISYWM